MLLGFSPTGDESSLNADEYIEYMVFALDAFKTKWTTVFCSIGDNRTTNKAIESKLGLPLVGCAIHCFNLDAQSILREENLFLKINALMNQLKNLTLSAKLLKICGLRAKTRSVTRWRSRFNMCTPKFRRVLEELKSNHIDELHLSVSEKSTYG